jgi:hypothetical protein
MKMAYYVTTYKKTQGVALKQMFQMKKQLIKIMKCQMYKLNQLEIMMVKEIDASTLLSSNNGELGDI